MNSCILSSRRTVVLPLFLLLVLLTATTFITSSPRQACAQSQAQLEELWVTNGSVRSVVSAGAVTYIAGNFSQVGPNTGNGVPINASSGAALATYPKVNGQVNAVVADGSGGWYIGGGFTRVGGLSRNRLAHILSDGSVDSAWNPDANGTVYAMILSGTTVYAGGGFTYVGGQNRNRLAALNASGGAVTAWNPNSDNTVIALFLSGTTIYAGGSFTTLLGSSGGPYIRNRIAAIDTTTGNPTAWDPNADNSVNALFLSGTTIYAGGSFTTLLGSSGGPYIRNRIAAIDTTTGNPTAWDPNADNSVNALFLSGTTIYAGGSFTTLLGSSGGPYIRNRIAAIDTTTGNPTAWDPNANNPVSTLALSGTTLYAGGNFTSIGGQIRSRLAALSTSTGNATAWNPNANNTVSALAVSGANIYAGGTLTSIGGVWRSCIAAIDTNPASPTYGQPTAWDPNANGNVEALALSGTTVYAGGGFTNIGGASRYRIAALDASSGAATTWNPSASSTVYTLAVSGTSVYAGGNFTTLQGSSGGPYTRNRIAAIDTTTGNPTAWDPASDGIVYAIALSGTTVYVGGNFANIGGAPRNFIAALNASSGAANSWNPNPDNTVRTIIVSDATVYVGGNFANIGGAPRNFIAALNASSGAATSWNPNSSSQVYALALYGSSIYAGGSFTNIGGQLRNRLAALDTTSGLATAWNPNASNNVLTLGLSGDTVYAGGDFTRIGDESRSYFAGFAGPPIVTSITPSSGYVDTTVTVTELAGAEFRPGATVRLTKADQTDITATDVNVESGSKITCRLNIPSDAAAGPWEVVVQNPDGQSGTLPEGFVVNPYSTWYLAEGCTAPGFETWVLVQNPNAGEVLVDLTLMTESGPQNPPALQDVPITGYSRTSFNIGAYVQTFNVSTTVTPKGGNVVCERAMYGGGRTWGTDSIGTTTPSDTWYLAEGATAGGFETWALVQNPNAMPVTVNLTLMTDSGPQTPGPYKDVPIPANSRMSFNLGEQAQTYNVSTQIKSTGGNVVCERAMYGGDRTWAHDSVGVTTPSPVWFMAEGATAEGFETWVLVQNPNADPVTVTLTLMTENGPQNPDALRDVAIAGNSRISFNIGLYVQTFNVSTQVNSTGGNVVCERAMYGGDRTWGTDSIGAAAPAPAWFMAEGATDGGFETWVLVQNPNADPVTVTLTLMTENGPQNPDALRDVAIAGNSRISFNIGLYVQTFNVSTQVNSTGGSVVCERAMYGGGRTWAHDSVGYAPQE